MTVIDVNTGKFISAGGTLERRRLLATISRRPKESSNQLRLRDIGGIVIIDFVDMVLESTGIVLSAWSVPKDMTVRARPGHGDLHRWAWCR